MGQRAVPLWDDPSQYNNKDNPGRKVSVDDVGLSDVHGLLTSNKFHGDILRVRVCVGTGQASNIEARARAGQDSVYSGLLCKHCTTLVADALQEGGMDVHNPTALNTPEGLASQMGKLLHTCGPNKGQRATIDLIQRDKTLPRHYD